MWSALTKTSVFSDETPLWLQKCISEKPRRSCPFLARVHPLPQLQKVPFSLYSTAMSFSRSPQAGNHEKWCLVKISDCRKRDLGVGRELLPQGAAPLQECPLHQRGKRWIWWEMKKGKFSLSNMPHFTAAEKMKLREHSHSVSGCIWDCLIFKTHISRLKAACWMWSILSRHSACAQLTASL